MLRADLDAPRRQRHPVKRIFDRPVGSGRWGSACGCVADLISTRRSSAAAGRAGRGAGFR
ncbi:hypothetical protein CGZ69_01365 [Streptomyces peucetius subsp. caesius ATCC 27952]|nr:hypothetical protein CGZ69_01365 [Streptomyces peucetius subsp. caesius ATCC 27952]